MKCDGSWVQQQGLRSGSSVDPIPTEVPSLVGLDWLFEHTDSEPDDTPQSNPGEIYLHFEYLKDKRMVELSFNIKANYKS